MRKLEESRMADFLAEYAEYRRLGLREGQSWMNALHKVDLDLYKEVLRTDADCFYLDEKINEFFIRILP